MPPPLPPDIPWLAWWLPLLCSLIYVCGALCLKYAARYRVSLWLGSWYANVAVCCASAPLWLIPAPALSGQPWWQAIVAGLVFWLGQFTTLVALDVGEVSIATPVLGLKILFVLIFMTLLSGKPPGLQLWVAGGLSLAALTLLQGAPRASALQPNATGHKPRRIGLTILLAAFSALAYALFDVLINAWSPHWGIERIIPLAFLVALLVSTLAVGARVGSWRIPRGAIPSLCGGSALIGLQSATLIYAIAWTQDPPRINLIYNSRGFFSILAVWGVGHWFDNHERHLGRREFIRRLCGAFLMLAAIFLAIT
ncbi:MAG: hypothetical protein SFX18_06380 [Pirellulales bacterium]|nr:hypothetical protein [Pirellulales bacterium]